MHLYYTLVHQHYTLPYLFFTFIFFVAYSYVENYSHKVNGNISFSGSWPDGNQVDEQVALDQQVAVKLLIGVGFV